MMGFTCRMPLMSNGGGWIWIYENPLLTQAGLLLCLPLLSLMTPEFLACPNTENCSG